MIDVDDALSEGAIANIMPAPAWDTPPTPMPIPRSAIPQAPAPPRAPPPAPSAPAQGADEHPTVFELTPLPADGGEPEPAQPWVAQPAPPSVAASIFEPSPPSLEPAAVNLVEMAAAANKLAAELRAFGADLSMAVWLFEHAGGGEAVQSFVQRVNDAHARPDDAAARQKVLEEAPTAARLLQAALMLFNALVPLENASEVEAAVGRDEQSQADTTELQPVTRL
jgi:hypothetical protein